jgi:phage tail sheath protein FI
VTTPVSYPGVYLHEAPSTVHTITPVATSITAFVGRAKRGPVNVPVAVGSWAEFVRQFGDFWPGYSRLANSVYDFFSNGGSNAVIVRVHHFSATPTPMPPEQDCATVSLPPHSLELYAASPGTWGQKLTVTVGHDTKPGSDAEAFNLTITDTGQPNPTPQTYYNVTLDPTDTNAAYLPAVLNTNPGSLVRVKTPLASAQRPDDTPVTPPTHFASASDGNVLQGTDVADPSTGSTTGINALDNIDLFNLLVIPPYRDPDGYGNPENVDATVVADAAQYCWNRKAFLLVDAPAAWRQQGTTAAAIKSEVATAGGLPGLFGVKTDYAAYAAVFHPRLLATNPATGKAELFAPSGAVAGVFAATDAQRGVWKAPAGVTASLANVVDMEARLTDTDNGYLNPLGINCLRSKPSYGPVVWGARTMDGADASQSQWKYVPVRRLALFLELSLYLGTQWVVFEPNDEPLWAQIRMNINAFMHDLFRQGAFQGAKPSEAYFVKCDHETTTQTEINNGIVNITVGFAPLLPAEFVVITLQQMAGQASA